MKRIDTTQETSTSWSPYKVESKAFMQDANKEMIAALCINIITNHGLTYSGTTPYLITTENVITPIGIYLPNSDGAVFYGGELYIMLENTGGLTYTVIDNSINTAADPTTFSDGTTHNIHKNRYLNFTNTSAGSLFAVANIVNVNLSTKPNPVITTYTGTSNVTTVANTALTLLFPNELSDLDTQFASGVFTAKKLGFYEMNLNLVYYIGASVSENILINFCKNGSVTNRCYYVLNPYAGSGAIQSVSLNTIFNVTSLSDTYTITITTVTNATVNVGGNLNYSYISQ
jgi:hypothetical protein